MKYSEVEVLAALTYCRELMEDLEMWANAFACEEPEAAQHSLDLIEKVSAFLERMNQKDPE